MSVKWNIIMTLTFSRREASLEGCPPGAAHTRRRRGPRATFARALGAWTVLTDKIARKGLGLRDGNALLWLRAFERHADGETHVHALMASPQGSRLLVPPDVLAHWVGPNPHNPKIGNAKVDLFDDNRARQGGGYVVKQADNEVDVLYSPAVARQRGDIR